jgi:hypothetical protein
MVNAIGTVNQNIHTMTLEGIDKLVETQALLPFIRGPLNMRMNWHKAYYNEPVPVGEGQKFIVTKEGFPTGNQDPTAPPSQTYGAVGLDSGLTPIIPGYEQFDLTMTPYRDTTDFKLVNSKVTNLNKFTSRVRNLNNKMATTLNTAYRRPISVAAQFGHAYATATYSGAGAGSIASSNVAGFHGQWIAGVWTPVSGSNKVRATLKHNTDTFLIDVSAVTVGARNDLDDITVGTLTFTVLTGNSGYTDGPITAISVGDPIVAIQATPIQRPNAKSSAWALDGNDGLKLDHVINVAAQMLSNGVDPNMNTGLIDAFGDFYAWKSLMKDADFRTVYRDRYAKDEFVPGSDIVVVGCHLQFGHDAPNTARNDGLKVRRLTFCGDGAGARGIYTQADPRGEDFMDSDVAFTNIGDLYNQIFDPITQIMTTIRKPINREADVVSVTETAILGLAAQPDTMLPFSENPNAAYKRIESIEFVA